ncbi:hypothetical protein SEA_SKOG_41 [Gordonia phage Skog]|uniref:Uncharacterized protein n=1 Tax=Gordonia phage Skog TaxID=2704033 RepID=A0A6G6XK91_9CAUD|nr:hypothetical protein KHQ85_gp041 [Gordonia phage Skog]QIG58193.1 hypothetical protein SEA_SKOG_41 [Gordonia phage Skog]
MSLNETQALEAMAKKMIATAWSGRGGQHGVGEIVGYCEAPQVLIRKPNGEQFWWRADQTTVAERPIEPPKPTYGDEVAALGYPWDHVEYQCTATHDDGRHCMFCDGGLFACEICGSFEGATTTQCPKVPMTSEQRDEVYAGRLDYRGGSWTHRLSFYAPGGHHLLEMHRQKENGSSQ